jgi:hypothetical protein
MKAQILLAGLALAYSARMLALAFTPIAQGATSCQTRDDANQRAYCRAMQTGSKGDCIAIGSHDLRQR